MLSLSTSCIHTSLPCLSVSFSQYVSALLNFSISPPQNTSCVLDFFICDSVFQDSRRSACGGGFCSGSKLSKPTWYQMTWQQLAAHISFCETTTWKGPQQILQPVRLHEGRKTKDYLCFSLCVFLCFECQRVGDVERASFSWPNKKINVKKKKHKWKMCSQIHLGSC